MQKLYNKVGIFFVLILCYGYSLVCGAARGSRSSVNGTASHNTKTLIIFHSGKLGDMVCATPIFRALKKSYPDCRVIVFGNAVNREIVAGNRDVDGYVVFARDAVMANVRLIKAFQADFACLLSPSFSNLASLFLSGIPVITSPKIEDGWSPYETKPYRMIRRLTLAVPHRMGSYAPREYLRLLEPIGIVSEDTTKHLSFSPVARAATDAFLAEHGVRSSDMVVGVSPSVGNAVKRWGADRFAELIQKITREYNAKIVLIGGKSDTEEIEAVIKALDADAVKSVIDAGGRFDIDGLKALISRLSVFVSVDTGPIYIAEAFDIPTIDIIGPMDEREQPPPGPKHINVVAPRKAPELHIMNARVYDEKEARRQVEAISVDDVMRAFCSLRAY
jgi:ADP-heptose:LPS heptosyltransferase